MEHKIDRIAEYADRVLLMDDGQIIADGPAAKVLSDPKLLEYGVTLPQTAMLGLRLRERDYELPEIPITIEQASVSIGSLLREENA